MDEFIQKERKKSQTGSGDDLFYEQHIEDYINKQRKFWITFMKFMENKINSKTSHTSYSSSFIQNFKMKMRDILLSNLNVEEKLQELNKLRQS